MANVSPTNVAKPTSQAPFEVPHVVEPLIHEFIDIISNDLQEGLPP